MTKKVVIQNWEESERGWGTRPDGFTIHISTGQRDEYVSWFNKTFNNQETAPDEYTRVSGYPRVVEVSDELYERVEKATMRVREGRVINCVHGATRYFDTSQVLKEEDVQW